MKWKPPDNFDHSAYSCSSLEKNHCDEMPELVNYQRDLITFWELPENTIEVPLTNKIKFYKCQYCPKIYNNPTSRYNHTCVQHFGWRSRCVICYKVFKWPRDAHNHIIKKHVNYAHHHAKYVAPIRFKSKADSSWEEYVKKARGKKKPVENWKRKSTTPKPVTSYSQYCSACSSRFATIEDLEQHLLNSFECLNSAHVCLTGNLCLTEDDLEEKPCSRKSVGNITAPPLQHCNISMMNHCNISTTDKLVIDKIINDVCCGKERAVQRSLNGIEVKESVGHQQQDFEVFSIPKIDQKPYSLSSMSQSDLSGISVTVMPQIVQTFSLAKKSVSTLRPFMPRPVEASCLPCVPTQVPPCAAMKEVPCATLLAPCEVVPLIKKKISILRAGSSKLFILAKDKSF